MVDARKFVRIRDMLAILRYQVFFTAECGRGNMHGIADDLRRLALDFDFDGVENFKLDCLSACQ